MTGGSGKSTTSQKRDARVNPGDVLERMKRLQSLIAASGANPDDPFLQNVQRLAMAADTRMVARIEQSLAQLAMQKALDERPFPLPKEIPSSGIPLGTLQNGGLFHYPIEELSTGMLAVGSPKSGKTTMACQVVEQLQKEGIGVLIADVRGDYSELATHVPGCLLIPGEEDRINVLESPDGVVQGDWLHLVAARLSLDLGLQTAGQAYCFRQLRLLLEKFEGQGIPCLLDLLHMMERYLPRRGSSEEGYHERLLGRVRALVTLAGESVVGVQRGFRVLEALDQGRLVILDMRRFDRLWSDFSLAIRLYGLYYKRVVSPDPFSHPLVMVLLDEQRGFIRERPHDVNIPDLDLLFSRSRALNLGFVICEQVSSAVATAVLTSCRLRLGFNTVPPEQQHVAKLLGLNPDQAGELVKLPPGMAIVRWSGSQAPSPFILAAAKPSWMA